MPALLESLKQLPDDTIVYHTAISQDAAGARFIDSLNPIPWWPAQRMRLSL